MENDSLKQDPNCQAIYDLSNFKNTTSEEKVLPRVENSVESSSVVLNKKKRKKGLGPSNHL